MDEVLVWSFSGMVWTRKIEVLGPKPVPLPFCPSEIPYGLVGHRTRAFTVRTSNPETT
jgi:hypothetical protein